MRATFAHLLFLPTVAFNVLLCRILTMRRWWSFIDDGVLLGAAPFASDVPGLVSEGVTGVLNLCAEYVGPLDAYARAGIRQHRLPTIDLTLPSLKDIRAGVAFIEEHVTRGETVYVHCKSGRNRSATILLCWLIAAKGLAPREAQQWLQSRRPHVNRRLYQRNVVQQFFATYERPMAANEPHAPAADQTRDVEQPALELAGSLLSSHRLFGRRPYSS